MAKSTVDLQIWLDDLTDALAYSKKMKTNPLLSIEIFNEGSFRILGHNLPGEEEVATLIDSEDLESHRECSINDLIYIPVARIAEKILTDASVRNIKGEEL